MGVLAILSLSFGAPEVVCDTTCENGFNHTYLYVDSAGNVHITYHRRVSGVWQVFYRMRDLYGWLPEERVVFTDTADAKYPSVVAIRDSVFLVWHDYRVGGISNVELFFNAKPVSGDTWAHEERLTYTSSGGPGDNGYVPSLKAAPDGSLRVVWYDYRDDPSSYKAEIYTKVRDTVGWGADVRVSDSPGNAWYPAFAFGPDGVLYVWADNRDGGYGIFGSYGTGDFPVSDGGYYPDAAYGYGRYVVVWQGTDGNVYMASGDTVWSTPTPVFPTGNPQKDPAIFPFPQGFVVLWREDVSAYDSDIFGVVLRPNLTLYDTFRLAVPGVQGRPTLFVDGSGYLHVACVDWTYGSSYPRILYLRSLRPISVEEGRRVESEKVPKSVIDGRRVLLRGRYDPAGRRVR